MIDELEGPGEQSKAGAASGETSCNKFSVVTRVILRFSY
jgi:hypothetical protein